MAASSVVGAAQMLETPRCQSLRAPARHARLPSTQKGEREPKLDVLAEPAEALGLRTEK